MDHGSNESNRRADENVCMSMITRHDRGIDQRKSLRSSSSLTDDYNAYVTLQIALAETGYTDGLKTPASVTK